MAEKRIQLAPSERVNVYATEVRQLLLFIAPYMTEPGGSKEDWVDDVFVSDQSCVFDFLMAEDIGPLQNDLGVLSLTGLDLIWEVAKTMHLMNVQQ